MATFAYPEEFSPRRLTPHGEFVVVASRPIAWPHLVVGPAIAGNVPAAAEFLERVGGRIVPLSEEAVVAAALADEAWRDRALACIHRRVQAELLGDLAPRWWLPDEEAPVASPWWYKASASDMSRGVGRVASSSDLRAVMRRCHHGAHENVGWLRLLGVGEHVGIVQEHVDAPQHEITGVVGECGQERWFEPLRQTWSGSFIERYHAAPEVADEMVELGREVVRRLGLAWCFVCIEARRTTAGWKVIEAHCRPGDDPEERGYPGALHLLHGIENICAWEVEEASREKISEPRLTSPQSPAMPR